jgi:uncharacterized protein HemX
MENDNKNIDSEPTKTESTLETETETELFGSFNSMNETADEESNNFKSLLAAIFVAICMALGSALYAYIKRH